MAQKHIRSTYYIWAHKLSLFSGQHGWCLTFKIGLIATHDYDIILLLVKDIRKSTFKSYHLVEEKFNNFFLHIFTFWVATWLPPKISQ